MIVKYSLSMNERERGEEEGKEGGRGEGGGGDPRLDL